MPDLPPRTEERTPDVSDDLLDLAWRAELARRAPSAGAEAIEEYCDFELHPSLRSHREALRPVLAAVLPEHARQVLRDTTRQQWESLIRDLAEQTGHERIGPMVEKLTDDRMSELTAAIEAAARAQVVAEHRAAAQASEDRERKSRDLLRRVSTHLSNLCGAGRHDDWGANYACGACQLRRDIDAALASQDARHG